MSAEQYDPLKSDREHLQEFLQNHLPPDRVKEGLKLLQRPLVEEASLCFSD